jgi:hypothetical protein
MQRNLVVLILYVSVCNEYKIVNFYLGVNRN